MNTATATAGDSKYQKVTLETLPHIPEKTLELFSINFARTRRAIPISDTDGQVTVAIDDPTDPEKIEAIESILSHKTVILVRAESQDMDLALERRYSEKLVGSRN